MSPKLPIAGSATSNTTGVYLTRKGAQHYAEKNMPGDLRRAGFKAAIVRGQEAHNGRYRDAWRVCYGK